MQPHSHRRNFAFATLISLCLVSAMSACSSVAPPPEASGVAASVAPPVVQKAGSLEVCVANTGSPPNVYADESGQLVGSEVDLAKAVGAQLGLTTEFVTVDFSALIPSLQAKQCDTIISTLYIKPARREVVDFVPYLLSGSAVAVRKGNPQNVTGLDDSLCGRSVMVTVGTTAQTLADAQSGKCTSENKKPIDISTNNQATLGFQQLASGQIDAYIDTAELIGYYENQGTAGIAMAGSPTDVITVGAATLKDNGTLHDALQVAFDSLMTSGKYNAILTQWGQQQIAYTK